MEHEIKHCAVIGSAPVDAAVLEQFDRLEGYYVICADGGYDASMRHNIHPDLLIGDFDSLQSPLPKEIETIRLPVNKDDTDLLAAVREGIKRGCRDFTLLGALGGARMDHTYANFSVLHYLAQQGCRGVAASANCRVFVLTGGKLTLNSLKNCTVSVFPFGAAMCNVSYQGMEYPLDRHTLYAEVPLGVSNRILDDHAQITVHSGTALVMVLLEQ